MRGNVESLGADCVEKDMTESHLQALAELLEASGIEARADSFKRFGSARALYNFKSTKTSNFNMLASLE